MSKPQRCSPGCPPRRVDGSISTALGSLCLICWNTGYRIPLGDKGPTIDQWIKRWAGKEPESTRPGHAIDGRRGK